MYFVNKHQVNNIEYSEIEIKYPDFEVALCDLGASIRSIIFFGKCMVATPKSFTEFVTNGSYYGRTIGRCAGRIENGTFTMNGNTYKLDLNADGIHNMHGGLSGLAFQKWDYKIIETLRETVVTFNFLMPNMQDGFPGNLNVKVIYTIDANKKDLRVDYQAISDKDTLFNVSNHSYFNIAGDLANDVLKQDLKIKADRFTKLNDVIICDKICSVTKAMDFNSYKKIGQDINCPEVVKPTNGYDHCFFFTKPGLKNPNVIVRDNKNKHMLTVYTTYPSVVVYTTNYHDSLEMLGKNQPIVKNDAICFECQFVPNGYNMNINERYKGILRANKTYHETIIYSFSKL